MNRAAELASAIKQAKEARFTLSSRILSGKQIRVKMTDCMGADPACYNTDSLALELNEACPRVPSSQPVRALVYDRAKLYHELGHAIFTEHENNRTFLMGKSSNPGMFLGVSNVLEDGRIERLMGQRFSGTAPFFDALLCAMMERAIADKGVENPLSSLVIYVRKKLWRNAGDGKYWQPFVAKINEAVQSDHVSKVCQIAFDIVEALAKAKKPEQPEQRPEQPSEGSGGKPSREEGKESDGPEGKGEGKAQPKPELQPRDLYGCEDKAREALKEISEGAFSLVSSGAKEEWDGILEEAVGGSGIQQYRSEREESAYQALEGLFRNVKTESERVRHLAAREGVLNSLALPKALTNRQCFQVKEEGPAKPHVALLLDQSGSMNARAGELSSAARVLNGALRGAGIETLTIGFGVGHGDGIVAYQAIGVRDNLQCHGSTPTAEALEAANDWLESSQAQRGLVLVVTDGIPNSLEQTTEQLRKCNALGGTVLGVQIGDKKLIEQYGKEYPVEAQFNSAIQLASIATLPEALESILLEYIAGGER